MSTELALSERSALELIESAEAAIDGVANVEDAEDIWRKVETVAEAARRARLSDVVILPVARTRLRALRRWGELLGPGEPVDPPPGGVSDGNAITEAERVARHRARKVAEVDAEAFRRFLERDDPDTLTRASLLRVAAGAVHGSSETDEWETPQELFDLLDQEFGFDLDVCALDSSAKCDNYFTPQDDGLAQKWTGTCWMNPPYGSAISRWVQKAWDSAEGGATVVCLVPARVDTGWWWDWCRFGEIRFLRGRLKFGDSETSAPFPSAVVIFPRKPCVIWWAS